MKSTIFWVITQCSPLYPRRWHSLKNYFTLISILVGCNSVVIISTVYVS
jgi:hypothetical protein